MVKTFKFPFGNSRYFAYSDKKVKVTYKGKTQNMVVLEKAEDVSLVKETNLPVDKK